MKAATKMRLGMLACIAVVLANLTGSSMAQDDLSGVFS
jgi:hypothetical protein